MVKGERVFGSKKRKIIEIKGLRLCTRKGRKLVGIVEKGENIEENGERKLENEVLWQYKKKKIGRLTSKQDLEIL